MAKSLKSKSKRTFRRIKREDPKSIYSTSTASRMSRLSTALKQSALQPKAMTDAEEFKRAQDGYVTEEEEDEEVQEEEAMVEDLKDGEVEGEEKVPVKVSTSGPRMSRRESYRADKKFMIRLPRKTEFRNKGERKIMSGKPHRRR